jgi:DNA-binding transcriptional MerR regulator
VKTYSIGEVEVFIGVKTHVLRYWETIIPGIAPQKDSSGRRNYSLRDIEKFSRLKFLIQQKKFTIEGARNELIAEASRVTASNAHAEILRLLSDLRSELIDLYRLTKTIRSEADA